MFGVEVRTSCTPKRFVWVHHPIVGDTLFVDISICPYFCWTLLLVIAILHDCFLLLLFMTSGYLRVKGKPLGMRVRADVSRAEADEES